MSTAIKASHSPYYAKAKRFILNLSCRDRRGIVAGVSSAINLGAGNISESAQFGDTRSGLFFMRVAFDVPIDASFEELRALMRPVTEEFEMTWTLHDAARRSQLILMVSRFDHCLQDLLFRWKIGVLPVDIAAVVSNHEDARATVEGHGLPFHHWPVTPDTKEQAEKKLLSLVKEVGADLVVLARYMQVLSDALSRELFGRAINIHHSFLPAFKGAKPYHQAFERGVKLIGATAHYVTADLDEGPIIAQATEHATHADGPNDLVVIGRDIEARVLARAVALHVERRVFLNGSRTVVFDR
ncbi:formyltetrahydrofolate deformylase [Bradyrhizobium sp. 180]|uniref:formyltetrahydrofolate deformylase n=1 Tax=Bradyrhizobium sp. 180 TaxID=2782650 RepID=UPI001FFAF4D8|nr:formyltetrahydrofolate deformylase [Bradyrhizobium sp. 180]MCK1489112.1 formyltetrahydrofolate deformylase [Bradyrhizobium sp. 180]